MDTHKAERDTVNDMGQGLSSSARKNGKKIVEEISRSKTRGKKDTKHIKSLRRKMKPEKMSTASPNIQHHDASDDEEFYIRPDAVAVSAGQWTGAPPPDQDMVEMMQSKDEKLVGLMREVPEIKLAIPRESIGSQKIHRSLPQDRSAKSTNSGQEHLDQSDDKLSGKQIVSMLKKFNETPHHTAFSR